MELSNFLRARELGDRICERQTFTSGESPPYLKQVKYVATNVAVPLLIFSLDVSHMPAMRVDGLVGVRCVRSAVIDESYNFNYYNDDYFTPLKVYMMHMPCNHLQYKACAP